MKNTHEDLEKKRYLFYLDQYEKYLADYFTKNKKYERLDSVLLIYLIACFITYFFKILPNYISIVMSLLGFILGIMYFTALFALIAANSMPSKQGLDITKLKLDIIKLMFLGNEKIEKRVKTLEGKKNDMEIMEAFSPSIILFRNWVRNWMD